ncbi:hypothetical protein [Emticicia sp. C21]|uniref:hypothetical protein n=1 Tax=Emticicia sp. C21 TaxID=2302915 RepID=UPI000E345946|nr:hypothetical protein [Emticicia sp. C21]RFS15830.1 hypothetical protein D0T08_13055 [Emticicia sp. C21]
MKNIRQKIHLLACLTLIIGMAACKSKATDPSPNEVAFQVSEAEYNRLLSARNSAPRHFEIKDIKRENDILKIWVVGGSCDKNRYKVVWDGIMRKSYPVTVFLIISLEKGTGNECDAIREYVLEIDLKEKFGEIYDTHDLHILLSNGSKIFDRVIDPDGIVTNK